MTLERGRKYEVISLAFTGWTKGDGSSTNGYSVGDYFTADGFYLGPDKHGIEPTFRSNDILKSLMQVAAEEMALRARQAGSTVAELFAYEYELRFTISGHTAGEPLEKAVDINPELIQRAEAILQKWHANDSR